MEEEEGTFEDVQKKESLKVPEEPSDTSGDDDDDSDPDRNDESMHGEPGELRKDPHYLRRPPAGGRTTPLTFFTAVGIARWMARAYGYVSKKKAHYDSQDVMHKRSALSRSDSTERDLCAPATTTTNPLSRLGNLTLGVGAASRPVSRCSSAQPPISEQVPADITKAGEGNRLKSGAALAAANRSRSSLELRRAASRRRSILMVEPAIQHLSPSRRESFERKKERGENSAMAEGKGVLPGEEDRDREVVCKWWAESYYGVEDSEDYYRAYSREIIRQCRRNYWDVEKTPLVAWI